MIDFSLAPSVAQLVKRSKKLTRIVRSYGWQGLLGASRNYLLHRENRRIEGIYGLDIQSTASLEDLSIVGDHELEGHFYGASGPRRLRGVG